MIVKCCFCDNSVCAIRKNQDFLEIYKCPKCKSEIATTKQFVSLLAYERIKNDTYANNSQDERLCTALA